MRHRRHVLLAAAASALLIGCGTTSVTRSLRRTLVPTGTLRVAVHPGDPMSLVRGPNSEPTRGLTVEIGRELARRLAVPVEFVVFDGTPQIVGALKAGQADFTIARANPDAAREIDFTQLEGRWGGGPLAIGVPKGREAAAAYLRAFVIDPVTQSLAQQAAQRAGLASVDAR